MHEEHTLGWKNGKHRAQWITTLESHAFSALAEMNTPGEVAEAVLAHTVPSAVQRAYKRTDFLAKRRTLMNAWGAN